MSLGYIYKIELLKDTDSFIKGEMYIGKHNGVKKEYFGNGKIIKMLLSKYGREIFHRTIISKDIDNDELLSYLEVYYINLYKCNRSIYNVGLNLTNGGEGIFGFKKTKEQCQALSDRIKKEYLKNGRTSPKLKNVYQYCLTTGVLLKTFNNCTEASLEVLCAPSSIAYCARGKNKSIKGFGWSYDKMDYYKPLKFNRKPIIQYTIDGSFIKEWDSATDVKNELGYSNSSITNCCKKVTNSSYNFKWEYKKSTILNH